MKNIKIGLLPKQVLGTLILTMLSVTARGAQMFNNVDISPMVNHFSEASCDPQ
ncbi:MAG: hypothetical protein IPK68_04700 [Bdellovibrionales bacterium]|nr:hypothetical protein [Bdellovibrionales bacterium]